MTDQEKLQPPMKLTSRFGPSSRPKKGEKGDDKKDDKEGRDPHICRKRLKVIRISPLKRPLLRRRPPQARRARHLGHRAA